MGLISFFNSKECEWADMDVMVGNAPLTKIRAISYKASKSKELLHGAGDMPIGIQSGNRTYEGEIKVLKGALDAMNRAAVALKGKDILDLVFDIVITYKPHATRVLQTDVLVGVQVKDWEKGWEQGATQMEISLPIIFMSIGSE
ncbi:hypothetical protein GCM10023093_17000 [Nemorincola caseinilytica]|uniref:Uncharacterized protein n=1 Tax=Nemorincola caseinilytica TaxID=2054315 RepID=A0ABP8NG01_9BACT